jgi:hypothetical protein
MSHDDQDWLDALAGRAAPGSRTAGRAEGELLRRAVRAAPRALPGEAASPAADLSREAALIARAAREGLIPAPAPARHATRASWRPLLAAAALGAFAFGLAWQFRPTEAPVVRDAQAAPSLIQASRPVELQQRILAELRAAGVDATGYESLGVHGIDADLPQPVPDAVRRILDAHGVPLPSDGALRIEIREPK